MILTNRPRSFIKSQNFETGLSDCHKLPLKIIKYRDQKNFNQKKFFHDLDSKLLQGDIYRNCNESY